MVYGTVLYMDSVSSGEKGDGVYNATAYKLDADGGIVSVQAVEVNENGLVVRAAGYWSHRVGTEAYDADWRSGFFSMVKSVRIEMDGGRGYMERVARIVGAEELLSS